MFRDAAFFKHWLRFVIPETTVARVAEGEMRRGRCIVFRFVAIYAPPGNQIRSMRWCRARLP